MAFYEDKREHYGGALVLFRRNLAVAVPNAKTHRQANWYMRLKIGGRKGYVTRSTKLTIYEDAYGHLYKFENAKGDRNENNHLRCGDQLFIPLIEVPISVFKLSAALYVLRFLLGSQSFLDTALSRHQVRSASVVLTLENDVRVCA